MSLSQPVYELVSPAPEIAAGLPLVIGLTGFSDAGSAVSQSIALWREQPLLTPLAIFDNDLLLDYRARRPVITFDTDHLTDLRAPRLELSLGRDALGQPYLLLAGYEPDFAWEAFSRAVIELATTFQVGSVTWVHAIPMPVPHTRPIGATVSGNRAALTEAHSIWKPHTQVPATAGHLLEYRFSATELPTAGFVLLVPHYLAEAEFPATAIAALDSVTVATGLVFDIEKLRHQNEQFLSKIGEQIEQSEELQHMLVDLEARYDDYMAGSTQASPLIHSGDLPSADELAAELERFLANRPQGGEDRLPGFG